MQLRNQSEYNLNSGFTYSSCSFNQKRCPSSRVLLPFQKLVINFSFKHVPVFALRFDWHIRKIAFSFRHNAAKSRNHQVSPTNEKTIIFPHPIHPASTTLATVPARVASRAPVRVYLVFVTFAARKYTLMV